MGVLAGGGAGGGEHAAGDVAERFDDGGCVVEFEVDDGAFVRELAIVGDPGAGVLEGVLQGGQGFVAGEAGVQVELEHAGSE